MPDSSAKKDPVNWQQLIHLSKDCDTSLKSQLRQSLVTAILDGEISPDKQLPSSRGLARQLGVARNTVVCVYQHLLEDGYLIAQERRGYFVNPAFVDHRTSRIPQPIACGSASPNWNQRIKTRFALQSGGAPALRDFRGFDYSFAIGQMDPTLFPTNAWHDCCRQSLETRAIKNWMPDSVDRDDPLLLEQIQRRLLPSHGVWVNEDQILVTMGAQNALYLLATLLINTGERVGFEDPGDPDSRNILERGHCEIVPLPVDAEGLIVDERINKCGLVYCTPSNQAPTSATLSLERRQELLRRARKYDVLIVESEFEGELNCSSSVLPALKSLDTDDRVIYVGTLSRTLTPGLRLGYIVGPSTLIDEVRALRRLMMRHPPGNNQNAVGRFLALGHHDSFLSRLSLFNQERRVAMDAALRKYLPYCSVFPANSGSAFWLKLPKHVTADELVRVAKENGILVTSGDSYFLEPSVERAYLRLGFSSIPIHKIPAGIHKLANLISEQCSFASNFIAEESKTGIERSASL